MPTVTYISHTGNTGKIEVPVGTSVMQAALNNRIEGIFGDCGGNCMCATCHVYVDQNFLNRLPAVNASEHFMLGIVATGRKPNSRLSCQIKVTEELDGLTVELPSRQR